MRGLAIGYQLSFLSVSTTRALFIKLSCFFPWLLPTGESQITPPPPAPTKRQKSSHFQGKKNELVLGCDKGKKIRLQGEVNWMYAPWDTLTVFPEEGLIPLTFSKDHCGTRSFNKRRQFNNSVARQSSVTTVIHTVVFANIMVVVAMGWSPWIPEIHQTTYSVFGTKGSQCWLTK